MKIKQLSWWFCWADILMIIVAVSSIFWAVPVLTALEPLVVKYLL